MVLYNIVSVPYVVAFVANICSDPIARLLSQLSRACQDGEGYSEVFEQHPDELAGYDEQSMHFNMRLQCASYWFATLNIVSDVVFFFDIVVNFLTGFVPKRSSQPVYSFRKIARNYVQDTFFLDMAATIPWEQVCRCVAYTFVSTQPDSEVYSALCSSAQLSIRC